MAITLTYKSARENILNHLEKNGWSVKRSLVIPQATRPDGKLRLWFKTQAVWYTEGNWHRIQDARTLAYDLDIRTMDGAAFEEWLRELHRME